MKTLYGLNQTLPRNCLPTEDFAQVKLITMLTPTKIFA